MSTTLRARLRALLGRLTMAVTFSAIPIVATGGAIIIPSEASDGDVHDDDDQLAISAHALAIALSYLPPMDATAAACQWALSTATERRAVLGVALAWDFPLVGDDVLIDHLAADPVPVVRAAAARAAWARRRTGGDPGVLERLAIDPAPEVREIAALALRG